MRFYHVNIYVPELRWGWLYYVNIFIVPKLTLGEACDDVRICPWVDLNRGIVPLLEKGEAWEDMEGTVILTMVRDSEESSISKDEAIACYQKPHILTNTHRWNLEHVSGVVLIPWALFVHFIKDDRKPHYLIIVFLYISAIQKRPITIAFNLATINTTSVDMIWVLSKAAGLHYTRLK